jgi:hypothetical protein
MLYTTQHAVPAPGTYSGFHFDPELGSRGPNAAKNYNTYITPPLGLGPFNWWLVVVVRVEFTAKWALIPKIRPFKAHKHLNPVSKNSLGCWCWIRVALRPAPIPPLFPPVLLVSLPIPPLCPPVLVVALCPPVPLVSLLIPPRVLRCPWCLLALGPCSGIVIV